MAGSVTPGVIAHDTAPGPVDAIRPEGFVPYDAVDDDVSTAPFVKLAAGPCDLHSGRRVGGARWGRWPGQETMQQSDGVWKQT